MGLMAVDAAAFGDGRVEDLALQDLGDLLVAPGAEPTGPLTQQTAVTCHVGVVAFAALPSLDRGVAHLALIELVTSQA